MNKTVEGEIDGIITRDYLRKQIKSKIFLKRPELATKITGKVIEKCIIFISGYIKCIKYHGIQPINSVEMLDLLTQECLDWVVEYVDGGGQ